MSQDVGAMPPPEGVTPDFDGGTSLQDSIVVVYASTFAVATVLLAMQLYTAIAIIRKLDWDIPLIFLSWAGSLVFFIGVVLAIPAGFGKHLWDVRATSVNGYLNLLLVLGLSYVWPPTLAKLAILVLYHRLFPHRYFRIMVYAVAAGLVTYTLVFTILLAGPCHPQKPGTGQCVVNLTVSQAVLNIVSDAIVIALPIPLIHGLKMPIKQKVTVGVLLGLGSGVVIVSCIRFGYVQRMEKNPDITWTQANASLWSCIEMNTGIICYCLAQLKPFVRRHMTWLVSFVSQAPSQPQSYSLQPSNINSNGRWRGDQASYGYQLHSVGRSQKPPDEVASGNEIVVVDEIQVDFTPSGNNPSASSTEDILAHKR
ncbi:hypothetical protein F66182_482 [Fusarium sp. NRRL 66182]|nr:hypothetical protein F66182_482 [Fusarium sp. NRRL 66182]